MFKMSGLEKRLLILGVALFLLLTGIFYVSVFVAANKLFDWQRRKHAFMLSSQVVHRFRSELKRYTSLGKFLLEELDQNLLVSTEEKKLSLVEMNLLLKDVSCLWLKEGKGSEVSSCISGRLPPLACSSYPCFATVGKESGEQMLMIGIKGERGEILWMGIPLYLFLLTLEQAVPSPYFSLKIRDMDGSVIWGEKAVDATVNPESIGRVKIPELDWIIEVIPNRQAWGILKETRGFFLFLAGGTFIALFACVLVYVLVLHRWLKGLRSLRSALEEVRRGHLDLSLIKEKGEIGDLLKVLGQIVEDFKRYKTASNISAVGRAISWFGHEIKNKLLPVKAFLEEVEDRIDDKEFIVKMGKLAKTQIQECEFFLKELSALREDFEITRKKINLRSVLKGAVNTVSPLLIHSKVELFLVCPSDLWVYGDEKYLGIAVLNLILNAIRAVEKEGRVEVVAWEEGDYFLVEVRDTGPGLPEWLKDRIFEPFVTIGKGDVPVGRGVGLTIVYVVVKAHDGEVFVFSEKGKGTTFRIKIPKKTRQK